ncbi:MAG: protein translocase subunit SecD [Proteobacteria bacterium]|nr:protein translocase subunit SecD [Pseudomonadota bacterium]
MLHFTPWKVAGILLTCLIGFVLALPNAFSRDTVQGWPGWLPHKQMPLGLDLQGGVYLLYTMDSAELKKDWLANLAGDARRTLVTDAKIPASVTQQGGSVVVRVTKPEQVDAALKELRRLVQPIGNALLGSSGNDIDVKRNDDGTITLTPTEAGFIQRQANAASASIETINRRINALGTAESTVVRQGRDRILVQFPGLQDATQLKALVGQTAKLSFHEVNRTLTAEDAQQGRAPPGWRVYPSDDAREGGPYLLREAPVVQGDELTDAQPAFDQTTNQPIITFRFNQAGARKFGRFTQEHLHEPFAIVLDGKVLSAPVIQSAILGGSGQISGNFTVESANNLAVQLRSGALPAKLTIVEERTVGASLGSDSISAAKLAGTIAAIATIVMTVLAYGTFGIFACVGLMIHLILTVALMTLVGSTLTLPGIAGLVLGVAMAVDANVLIYERIREELRAGKTPIAAIDAGFSRAFITIADSQLTTLACAAVMFWLGSGPIRGFAITLTFGILTSIFSSVTVVRLLISWWLKAQTQPHRTLQVPV